MSDPSISDPYESDEAFLDDTVHVPTEEDLEPLVNAIPDDYVAIVDPLDLETGEIICATLAAQGIHAVMQNPMIGPGANALPMLGNTWSHAIYVAPEDVEAATAILNASPPSEDELAAEQEADPTTLEEAESRVRNA